MTSVQWLACDLVTGQIIEELPDLTPQGPISAMLGNATSAAFSLPLGQGYGAPPREWEGATTPGRSMIVAVLRGRPIWAGAVLRRQGGSEGYVTLATASLEAFLDRRHVSSHEWVSKDEASVIAAGLIEDAQAEGIGFVVDAPATGTLRDRTYLAADGKTVFAALRELMGVQDGPEWTITVDWEDDTRRAVRKTLLVRKRIGVSLPTPSAVFATVGASDATYSFDEDYTTGRGANHIVAVSTGEGDSRPMSEPARDEVRLAAGMPRWELFFSPSSSITDTATLDAHAQSALAVIGGGAQSLTITARADAYPVLGSDWSTGDDIGFDLVGPRHPNGLTGTARAVGWSLDAASGQVSPILLSATDLTA